MGIWFGLRWVLGFWVCYSVGIRETHSERLKAREILTAQVGLPIYAGGVGALVGCFDWVLYYSFFFFFPLR